MSEFTDIIISCVSEATGKATEGLQSDMCLPQRETQHGPGAGPVLHRSPVRMGFLVDREALGQVSLRVFLFPLSVSFNHCSIFMHSPVTDAV